MSWKKSLDEDFILDGPQKANTIALSAFTLSALPTAQARKVMVREMWESGAEVIVSVSFPSAPRMTRTKSCNKVLIDHSTTSGFECISEAREWLLRKGRKEAVDPAAEEQVIPGSHVVAPVSTHNECYTDCSTNWCSSVPT